MPIDVVKLAPQLTAAVGIAGRQQAVLESLIHLGHTLGMQVVAQGIETAAQLDALCRMGCELGQGTAALVCAGTGTGDEADGTWAAADRFLMPEPGPSV